MRVIYDNLIDLNEVIKYIEAPTYLSVGAFCIQEKRECFSLKMQSIKEF